MILTLFAVIVFIALVMIIVGLVRPTESAQALIGFTFLFLMSIVLINGSLQYETGATTSSNFTYDNTGQVITAVQAVNYSYENFDDTTSHRVGYWMAIAAVIGFLGVILSLRRTKDYGK